MIRGRQRKDISMKRFGFIVWAGLLMGAGAQEQAWEAHSPDGKLAAEVQLGAQGKLIYQVKFNGAPLNPWLVNFKVGYFLKLNFDIALLKYQGGYDLLGVLQFRYNYFPAR